MKTSKEKIGIQGHHLSSDELADVLQPGNVLLLLLESNVVGDHILELNVETTLFEVAAPEGQELGVEVLSGRAGVEALASPVLLGSVSVGDLGILEVGDLLDLQVTVLDDSLDQESSLVGLLDGNVKAGGEGRGEDLVLALNVAALVVVLGLVTKSVIVKVIHGVLGEIVNIGDGESNADTVQDSDN